MTQGHATLGAAFFGRLDPHPWIAPESLTEDAYSLFNSRSHAMGWCTGGPGDLWGMNDAGEDWTGASDGPLAWFQVGLPGGPSPGQLLPVQPMVSCAASAIARLGTLRLDGLQLLLPVQYAGVDWGSLAGDCAWTATCDPAAATTVLVRMEVATGDATQERLDALPGTMPLFVTDVVGPVEQLPVQPSPLPVFFDERWLGTDLSRAALRVNLPEWSPEALGWLACAVVEACRSTGIDTGARVDFVRALRRG